MPPTRRHRLPHREHSSQRGGRQTHTQPLKHTLFNTHTHTHTHTHTCVCLVIVPLQCVCVNACVLWHAAECRATCLCGKSTHTHKHKRKKNTVSHTAAAHSVAAGNTFIPKRNKSHNERHNNVQKLQKTHSAAHSTAGAAHATAVAVSLRGPSPLPPAPSATKYTSSHRLRKFASSGGGGMSQHSPHPQKMTPVRTVKRQGRMRLTGQCTISH